jgi:TP901 family phage tail tape measure protein
MPMNWFGLGFSIQAKDQTGPAIASAEGSLNRLSNAAAGVGRAFAGMAVLKQGFDAGIGFMKSAFDMTDDAKKFELSMAQLRVISHANVDEMAAFRKGAIDSGIETMHGPQEAVDVMKQLAQNGFSAAQALTMSKDALKLLTASGGEIKDAGDAAQILAMSQRAFGVSSREAIDQLAMTANMTSASFGEMQTMVSHMMRGTGMKPKMEEAFALAGLARNMSGNMENASTSVAVMMERFQNVKKMKPFEALGVEIFDKKLNQFKGPVEIMQSLFRNEKWKKLDLQTQVGMLSQGFGSRQQGAINSLMIQMERGMEIAGVGFVKGGALLDAFVDKIKNSKGASDEFVNAVTATYDGMEKRLISLNKTLRIQAGEGFMEVFRPIIGVVAQLGVALARVFEAIPIGVRVGIARAAVLAAVFTTATFAVGMLIAALPLIGMVFGAISTPLLIAVGAMAAITAAAGVMGAAFYAAWKTNLGGVQDLVMGAFTKIKLGFEVFKQLFERGSTWGDIDKQIMDPENNGLMVFIKQVWMWLGRIKQFAMGVWDGFVEGIQKAGLMQILIDDFKFLLGLLGLTDTSVGENVNMWNRMADIGRVVGSVLSVIANVGLFGINLALGAATLAIHTFQAAWWLVGPLVKSVLDFVFSIIQVFTGLITGNFDLVGDGIWSMFKSIASAIVNLFGTAFKFITSGVDALAGLVGIDTNFGGRTDSTFREADASLMGQKFAGKFSLDHHPGIQDIKGQAVAQSTSGGSTPVQVNMTPAPVILNIDGGAVARGVIKYQHNVDARSMMSVAPVHSGVERP